MKHAEIAELASLLEKSLSTTRVSELESHLATCPACQGRYRGLQENEVFLKNYPVRAILREMTARKPLPGPNAPRSKPSRQRGCPSAPRIPDYTLLNRIGRGSFGEVWAAKGLMNCKCAVKLLRAETTRSTNYELAGIKKIQDLRHEHLVEIRHVGKTKSYWYYTMELMETTLAQRLKPGTVLPLKDSLSIISSLLRALKFCHDKKVAHRDIKPANIGFTAQGVLKLLDLGLVTDAGRKDCTRVGTPDYMPERPAENPAMNDLYAAGIILYQLLTGQEPTAKIPEPVCPPGNSGLEWSRLYAVAQKAAERQPENRFRTAADFLAALEEKSIPDVRISNGERISMCSGASAANKKTENKITKGIGHMKSMNAIFEEAAVVAEEIGLTSAAQNLRNEAARLGREKFRVAFVGQFKTGKTTVVNRVFLKKDILFTDDMEATAVPTEIEHGDPIQLEVYPCAAGIEGAPWRKENPTPADIRQHTTADGNDQRAALARETSRVRLHWPAAGLKGLTVVDTPGINTPNEAVAATTYRVIPEADVVVFMSRLRQLQDVDLKFLRQRVFDQGISRCLVAGGFDSAKGEGNNLNKVLSAIEAQLRSIGRDYVPVVGVDLGSNSAKKSLAQRMHGWLSRKPATGAKNNTGAADGSLASFEETLLSFIQRNALPGRLERASAFIQRELQQAILKCQVELNSLQKSEEEKAAIRKKIEAEAEAFRQRYLKLAEQFLEELRSVQRTHSKALFDGVDETANRFKSKLDRCATVDEVRALIETAQEVIQPDIEEIIFRVMGETRGKIKALEQKYQVLLQEAASPWFGTVVSELHVDGGILAGLPGWLITLLDYLLFIVVFPTPALLDILLRLIAAKIPALEKILPTSLARKVLVNKAKDSITNEMKNIKDQMRQRMDSAFAEAQHAIQASWEANCDDQIKTIVAPLERAMNEARDPGRAQILATAHKRFNDLIDQLKENAVHSD